VIKYNAICLINKQLRRMGEWRYSYTVSYPRRQMEVSDQLHAPPG